MLAEKIVGETTEFFLPGDFGEFCSGCTRCFVESETKCPHFEKLSRITRAMDEADVIILASPVYVYHATGAMKAFLDHYGYRWMAHRPEEKMLKKQGVWVKTGLKTRGFFFIMHMLQKNGWNEADARYWKEKGWTGKMRPWKKSD